ncbi:MAG TPA: hypothetical protein VK619_04005 [Pyrinomonadaceae bacterium]|nr:hypothetical protein [Pyrinomonadaceae bacterium]
MNSKGRDTIQRILAIVVIVAMLNVMGIPASVLVFFSVVTFFIWRAVQRSEHQETGRIFEFYVRANDILREEERRWYGFEINKVIEEGERVLHQMSDPPPLVHFALGALYHAAGDHEASVEHLSYVIENDLADERHQISPSPELRRYVYVLRKLEREPTEAPQTLAAIRSLERARRSRAILFLNESRERLKMIPTLAQPEKSAHHAPLTNDSVVMPVGGRIHGAPTLTHTPITEVLRDVYDEEKKTA